MNLGEEDLAGSATLVITTDESLEGEEGVWDPFCYYLGEMCYNKDEGIGSRTPQVQVQMTKRHLYNNRCTINRLYLRYDLSY